MINAIIGTLKLIEDSHCFYFNKVTMFHLLNFNMPEIFYQAALEV